jgi:transglutaminase-like putative cysteine protease
MRRGADVRHLGYAPLGRVSLSFFTVAAVTHAWLEALIGDGESGPRWVGLDPTKGGVAGETHVKIGHGRSYQDVAPIRGVYRGRRRASTRRRYRCGD